jgi:hypothetical protein
MLIRITIEQLLNYPSNLTLARKTVKIRKKNVEKYIKNTCLLMDAFKGEIKKIEYAKPIKL